MAPVHLALKLRVARTVHLLRKSENPRAFLCVRSVLGECLDLADIDVSP
jgi:hypothetical protein